MFSAVRFRLVVAIVAMASAPYLGAQVRPVRPPSSSSGPPARAFGTIDGIVSDTSLVPLQAAFVSILGTSVRIGTGPNGRFRITKVPAGQYLVIVKHVGHRPTSAVIDVPANDTLRLSYTLEPAAVELNPVVIAEKAPALRMQE